MKKSIFLCILALMVSVSCFVGCDVGGEVEVESYTITFVADEETVSELTYEVGDLIVNEPGVPSKEGYTGVWSSYKLGEENITVTAVYTLIDYTITFVADGESVYSETYTVEDKTVTEPSVPQKGGYTASWEAYQVTTGDITVNAVYTAVDYTATFIADGVTVGVVTYTVEDESINEPGVPSKEGYAGAWENYSITDKNITVNAVYTAIDYDVTISAGDYGSVDVTVLSDVAFGSTITVSGSTITIDGTIITATADADTAQYSYAFDSWSVVDGEKTGTNTTITASFTRTVNSYSVSFNNGESVSSETLNYGATITAPTAPSKTGYAFKEWNTSVDGTGSALSTSTTVTGEVTYYAVYSVLEVVTTEADLVAVVGLGYDVTLGANITLTDILTISNSVTIDGAGFEINCVGVTSPIRVGHGTADIDVVIKNVEFANVSSASYGTVILVQSGDKLTVESCEFSSVSGSAIGNCNATLVVTNSTFTDVVQGIYTKTEDGEDKGGNATTTITGCLFTNSSYAVYTLSGLNTSTVLVDGNTFENCATFIAQNTGVITVVNNTFEVGEKTHGDANFKCATTAELMIEPSNTITGDYTTSGNTVVQIGVSTEQQLRTAITSGGYVVLQNDISCSSSITANDSTVVFDLNGYTLSMKTVFMTATDFTFNNGNISISGASGITSGSITMYENSSISLNKTTYTAVDGAAIYVVGSYSTVNVVDSTIIAQAYCVTTNASQSTLGVVMNYKNSTFTTTHAGGVPLFINIPGIMNVENCVANTLHVGLVVRGGTANVDGLTINYDESITDDTSLAGDKYLDSWSSGTCVPSAPIVLGNKGGTSYAYSTEANLTNITVNNCPSDLPTIYTWGHAVAGVDISLTLNYDSTISFEDIDYNGSNLIVNGVNYTVVSTASEFTTALENGASYIVVTDSFSLELDSKLFIENTTTIVGVGDATITSNQIIIVSASGVVIDNVNFSFPSTTDYGLMVGYGEGVYSKDVTDLIDSFTIKNSSVSIGGGYSALYIGDYGFTGEFVVDECTFNGGAVAMHANYLIDVTFTVTNNTISNDTDNAGMTNYFFIYSSKGTSISNVEVTFDKHTMSGKYAKNSKWASSGIENHFGYEAGSYYNENVTFASSGNSVVLSCEEEYNSLQENSANTTYVIDEDSVSFVKDYE